MMECCGDSSIIDFDEISKEFADFINIGIVEWPVCNYITENPTFNNIIMIHSPVGTGELFDDKLECKIIVSGFSTSLKACSEYLKDVFSGDNLKMELSKINNSFNSNALRTNINKILYNIGLFDKFGIRVDKSYIDKPDIRDSKVRLVKRIQEKPDKYPIFLTQMLCCIGIDNSSDANKIMKFILSGKMSDLHKSWVTNSINAWKNKIISKKHQECLLIILGHNSSYDSASEKLVTNMYMNDKDEITFGRSNISLLEYLRKAFNGRVIFVPHPSQLTDKTLDSFLLSGKGREAKEIVQEWSKCVKIER